MRKSFLLSAVAPALLLGACLGGCKPASRNVVFATAGPFRESYGQMNKRGFQLALSHIRSDSQFRGLTIDTLVADDDGDGRKALEIAERFVADERVVGVVGHVTSGAMRAAAKVYDGRLTAIATTATAPELSGVSPWVFRVIPSDSATGVALAQHARRLGRSRVAILYENNAYGRGLTEAFRKSVTGKILSIDPIGEAAGQDYEPFVAFFQQRKPDLVFVAGTEVTGLELVRALRAAGVTADLMGGDGWTGLTADPAASEGAIVAAPFTPVDGRPVARRFTAEFRARYDAEPDGNAALAYDATMLLARAVKAVGADRRKVRDWLATRAATSGYEGVTGPLRFNEAGDPVGKSLIMTRIRRGVLEVETR
ncbi:MAG TPA: ABC transporter substrate-binding protein [Gemmatimonadaceae bacterium]|nr:ABC transporter substrate-binding protein [Gemmatimonadaceae bacterium]